MFLTALLLFAGLRSGAIGIDTEDIQGVTPQIPEPLHGRSGTFNGEPAGVLFSF